MLAETRWNRLRTIKIMFLYLILLESILSEFAQSLGGCYGGQGTANNLPPDSEVVSLCKAYNIRRVHIYSPYTEILPSPQRL